MECRKCAYGKEDFERRTYWHEKTVQGILNGIYGDLKPAEALNDRHRQVKMQPLILKDKWLHKRETLFV